MLDTITDFDLSHNALMNEGLDMVCQLISVSGVLRRLNLAGNDAGLNNAHRKVSGHGTEALAQALLCSRGLQHLDLSDNDIAQLPLALVDLQSLTEIKLSGNPRLQTVAKIAEEKGVPGVFDYLRDLNDDPQPQYKIKLLLAGPSMAGKSSLLRRLLGRNDVLTDAMTERTIGLDIQRLWLPDPLGRALEGIELVCYDVGGHDEYQVCIRYFRFYSGAFRLSPLTPVAFSRSAGDAADLRDARHHLRAALGSGAEAEGRAGSGVALEGDGRAAGLLGHAYPGLRARIFGECPSRHSLQIGRASCRERVFVHV
jgi:hypothetical protein